jgi:hypothetical protein
LSCEIASFSRANASGEAASPAMSPEGAAGPSGVSAAANPIAAAEADVFADERLDIAGAESSAHRAHGSPSRVMLKRA